MGYVPRSSRMLELKIQELVLSVALESCALVIESWLMIIGEYARRQHQQLVLLSDGYVGCGMYRFDNLVSSRQSFIPKISASR
ncbi:uncharacterized protein Bfra_010702 [Botrytis fragariae]|uniref:Uncharacterized protein n=1 Tax=Botrytis fragariae TaxID=1964551 RepID=A0A8H6AI10_9HELO|nr:uncharacterized protein Bfra_010702 [Botrytis fragariae]KAF5867732.1 hypothetical protein Bfra_010702 [Botrytis fragariae]